MDQIIGPNRCSWCGGEYGQHKKDCANVAKKKAATKKRNSKDATTEYDVAPLRRRIEENEADIKELKRQVRDLQDHMKAMDELNGIPAKQN